MIAPHDIILAGREAFAGLMDLLLPDVCASCGAAEPTAAGLCDTCNQQLLHSVTLGYCPRCGASLGPNVPARMDGCAACPTTLPRFQRLWRLGPYAPPSTLR